MQLKNLKILLPTMRLKLARKIQFFGKMLVFVAAVDRGYYAAVALAVVGAAAGFYYYFKPILAIYSAPKPDAGPLQWSALARSTAYVLMALIVVLGVYPRVIQSVLKPGAPVPVVGK
jgi:NADH-quinone oxidoreductase subunit N